jgi:opacity protein-like surface antigen
MITRIGFWTVVVALVTLFPSLASAQNLYVAVRGGPGFTSDSKQGIVGGEDVLDFKTGFMGGLATGYSFAFGLRAEGEFGVVHAPVKSDAGVSIDGSFTDYLLMANGFYDLKLFAPIKPYVGFGLGVAWVTEDHTAFSDTLNRFFDVDESRTAFAYQARAGVAYEVNKWLDVSLGYRFVHIDGGDRTAANGPTIRTDALMNHSVELGVAFKF